jgi:arginase
MQLAVITLPYSTDSDAGTAAGPDALLQVGLVERLRARGHDVAGPFHSTLAPDEAAAYGAWNRIGLADAHLARLTSQALKAGAFPILLESNCYGAIGALAGLRTSAGATPPRLGMVWIDAHGDYNTPETTLSGMLSGMPVAIATGLCLERLRRQAGLDHPISARDVVMVCVRANDPLEQELIERSSIEIVPVADVRATCTRLRAALERLSGDVDLIYVHLDVDALDEAEVASMWLTAADGPTTAELARALEVVMAAPKVAAFGIADINPERDFDGRMVGSALTLLYAAILGLAGR